jgi:hypothetical protein
LKKDTEGAGVHSPSGGKETDEVFLMIILFYEGVKEKRVAVTFSITQL